MLHAKTAVADARWARVGSSNMNLASWLGNWELDVVVEDEAFGEEMQQMYLEDLANSTEIVLDNANVLPIPIRNRAIAKSTTASTRRRENKTKLVLTKVLQAGTTVQAVVTNRRALGPAEAPALLVCAGVLLFIAAVGIEWPFVISSIIGFGAMWLAVSLLIRFCGVWLRHRKHLSRSTGK